VNRTGWRFPTDVLFYEVDALPDAVYVPMAVRDGIYHPTQKPIALARWLIRTYSNPGELILDNACGSGTFLLAAVLEGRTYLGMEKNDRAYHFGKKADFIAICKKRLDEVLHSGRQLELFFEGL
jgi:hypothetical protein